jgi:hypothetical protein
MDKKLQKILRKVESVQLGLLRCHHDDENLLLQTRAGTNESQLNCIVENKTGALSLLSRNVNLIQKDKEDYLHISCRVMDEIKRETATIVSMEVLKACWFTKVTRGSVCWLKEKYIYEPLSEEIDLAS